MKAVELEVYDATTNAAVVRMPNRRFPGVVVQGDTLSNFRGLARSIRDRAKGTADEELKDESDEPAGLLATLPDHYARVLKSHGIELPYSDGEVGS